MSNRLPNQRAYGNILSSSPSQSARDILVPGEDYENCTQSLCVSSDFSARIPSPAVRLVQPRPHGSRIRGVPTSESRNQDSHHKYWHFVDTPFSTDGTTLPALPTPNAGTQIATFRAVLASNDPDEKKSYDLVWIEHLVGDVHQPLHSATRVSHTDPNGDNGGN